MKKLYYLIILTVILGLVLTGCSLLSNISQVPATEQSSIAYLTKALPPPDDLVGLWHFDESDGITASDSSGNDNHGTLTNMSPPGCWVSGMFGNALSFDGEDNIIRISHSNSLNISSTITVEAWVKADTLGSQNAIIRKGLWDTAVIKSWGLDIQQISGVKKARFFIYDGKTGYLATSGAITTGTWHHLVGTYNGTTVDIYLDGNNALSTSGPHVGYIDTNNEDIVIGMRNNDCFFDGLIDEVRIWNRALTGDEIADNYKNLFMDVEIDIKPGSYPNSINLGSNGVVPVAILGSADFDAATVNPSTVTLSGAAVKLKGKSGKSGSLEDVNGDGQLDLVVQIYTDQLAPPTGETTAVLHAYTYTGLPFFTGSDVIRIVPPE